MSRKKSCQCEECKQCCWRNPGWFGSIKEIQGAAKLMNMTTKKFCQEYLIIEYWLGDSERDTVYVPAPRRNFSRIKSQEIRSKFIYDQESIRNGQGFVKASWAHNLVSGVACILLDDKEKCSIHKSKPTECREAFGCVKSKEKYREKVLNYWKNRQAWIFKQSNESNN